jgi:DNA polymerase elongation subunit (family B)
VRQPKVLLYDIETAPIIGTTWGMYEQNLIWIIEDWHMLTFAYKWLGENKVHVLGLDDFPEFKKDPSNDKALVQELHKLFDEADIVIAHNGDSFDQKMSNTRFMVHHLPPPSPYKQIDTKKIAKRNARFTSNKLDDLGKALGLGQKLDTDKTLWQRCLAGDKKAWAMMKRYNKQDVVLLEQLYKEFLPWISNHPGMNMLSGNMQACPKCNALGRMQKRGLRTTKVGTYQQFQCQNCGGWCQERTPLKGEKPTYVN